MDGIGAQDNDRIEMHVACCGSEVGSRHSLRYGAFTETAGWVWAECLRESAVMRREAFMEMMEPETEGHPLRMGAHEYELERGIPAWPVKEAQR